MTSRAKPKPKPLKATRSEAEVTREVLDCAALYGLSLDRQNTGGCTDSRGQYVAFGVKGNADLTGTVSQGPNRGRTIQIEVKREGFNPAKLRSKSRDHFDRQLARLEAANAAGGLGLWVDSALAMGKFCARLADTPGLRIEFEDGFPVMVYGEET